MTSTFTNESGEKSTGVVDGGRLGAGTVEVLSEGGVPCRCRACRYSRFISKVAATSGVNLPRRRMCGALIAIKGANKRCIFIVPVTTRLSLGGTTGSIKRGSMRVLRIGSVATIANCIHNNYATVKVGGRFPAIVSSDTRRRRCVCMDNKGVKVRVGLGPSSLGGTTQTRCKRVAF